MRIAGPIALFMFVLFGTAILGPTAAEAAPPAKSPPPVFAMRSMNLQGPGRYGEPIARQIRFGLPKGWDGESDGAVLRLFGPTGKMLIAGATHPGQLSTILQELKKAHPSAAPSPPEPLDLPGIRTEHGERATRFIITGREAGEMVMIEKQEVILLFVTVVDPNAWTALKPIMDKAYTTVEVRDLPLPKKKPKRVTPR